MVRFRRWLVLAGVMLAMGLGAGFAVWRKAHPEPRLISIHVSGAPGTWVGGSVEVDGVSSDLEDAELPIQISRPAHEFRLTALRVSGPDEPISVAVDIDRVRKGAGTAVGGVRVGIWGVQSEPWFSATESDPEWQETHEAGPCPNLIGTQPTEWTPVEWINSERLRLSDLRGQVVLVRWFTGTICPDCVATAPALREFHERYHDLGLAVVGMYLHSDATLEEVRGIADGYGYHFPIVIDRGAKTRRLWCLGRYDYGYTIATFLLDREGVIRHIHPGGRYVKGDDEYRMMKSHIEHWLAL